MMIVLHVYLGVALHHAFYTLHSTVHVYLGVALHHAFYTLHSTVYHRTNLPSFHIIQHNHDDWTVVAKGIQLASPRDESSAKSHAALRSVLGTGMKSLECKRWATFDLRVGFLWPRLKYMLRWCIDRFRQCRKGSGFLLHHTKPYQWCMKAFKG